MRFRAGANLGGMGLALVLGLGSGCGKEESTSRPGAATGGQSEGGALTGGSEAPDGGREATGGSASPSVGGQGGEQTEGGAGPAPEGSAGEPAATGGESSGSGGAGGAGEPAATGGESSLGGAGGAVVTGGLDPEELAPPPGILTTHKVDLLFVVDNSASMQDKQVILSLAIPDMLEELVNPPCVDESGGVVAQPGAPSETCSVGSRRIPPVADMHVGVITSSLGGHGHPTQCEGTEQENDRARLVPTVRAATAADAGNGFVAWGGSADGSGSAPLTEVSGLYDAVSAMITAAGEKGCGYEATLEAFYRFLIDPEPPAQVVQEGDLTVRQGIDTTLLEQRAAFLRPDSALVIVLLSDENDCSIRDSGFGWVAMQNQISLGTSACAVDPNDPCCTYCGLSAAPAGCPDIATDPACQLPKDTAANVRCWDQKRRFGIDFLYPVSRYVAGLRDRVVCPDSSSGDGDCGCRSANRYGYACDPGEPVPNPIYQDLSGAGLPVRDRSLVFLLSVVGVPWQDLATDPTLQDPVRLEYKTGTEIDWSLVVGDRASGTPPLDALMIESPEPRTGPAHPLTGVAPQPPESGTMANPINGHEWAPQNLEDLQYACVFPLPPVLDTPRDCNVLGQQTCDCFDPTADLSGVNLRKKPLCQGEDGAYSSIQSHGKAYPGVRELELTRSVEESGFAASICPKILDTSSPYFGYAPALGSVLDRLVVVID